MAPLSQTSSFLRYVSCAVHVVIMFVMCVQVSGVMEECQELRLRCETLVSSVKTAELDSKAGRETILRLVAEGKKQERGKEEARKLQGEVERLEEEMERQRASLTTSEQERVGMQERLIAAKETMVALQNQLNAKEEK